MSEWISDNWIVLVCAVLYVIVNATSLSAAWRRRLTTVMEALETDSGMGLGKGHVKRAGLDGDTILDSILDGIQPKTEKRVSLGKKILGGALKFLPFLIR